MEATKLAPGVHRVETVTDGKIHAYHVLDGVTGPVLVDAGYATAPTEVYEPFLAERGKSLADVAFTLVTHADADHHGGLAEVREHSPGATVLAHQADVPLIESVERIMTERYGRFERDGISYDEELRAWLRSIMGPDERVDVALRGGETLAVGDRRLQILHTPGHTHGHLMLFDRAYDLVIGADGFFGRGLIDVDGAPLQPPPYLDASDYENTVRLVDSLDPTTLSFTHYPLFRGDAVGEFVDESLATITEFETLAVELASEGPVTLEAAIEQTVDRRGSFGLDLDLAFPLLAHFESLSESGLLSETDVDGRRAWEREKAD